MPGIAGIIYRESYDGVAGDFDRMVESLRHEEFYSGNQYINKDLGICVGWMAHKGSYADCMPLVSHNGDVVLIFQGEDYLDSETATRVRSSGVEVNEFTASYLMNLYEHYGDEFLSRLNGWFCGVLVNLRTRKITLFNDRYGMSRVYISGNDREFLFSSEAKSLLKVRPALRSLDPEAVAQHLGFNCVTGGRTLFRGISLLPNASAWSFENSVVPRKQQYFDRRDWEEQPHLSNEGLYDKFVDTVGRVFPRYARGSQRVGISLTGGFDTRLIMAAVKNAADSFPCYTFGGTWGETYDIGKARQLAKIKNYGFDVIRIGKDFFRNYSAYARKSIYLSDGTHDAFGAHDVYFNEIARKIAPIRLTGKFGSEVVRVRKLMPKLKYQRDVVIPEIRRILDQLSPLEQVSKKGHDLSGVIFDEIPWCESGRVAVEQALVTLRTPYMDNELVKLMFQASYQMRSTGQMQARFIKEKAPELTAILTNLGGMATENPFLIKLIYLLYRSWFKVEYVYLYATPHWLTRIDRKLEKWKLEEKFSGRQKFEGYRIWIKTELADFIQQMLLNPRARYHEFFDRKSVETMVRRHVAGTHNYLPEINKVLTLELIYSTLLNSDS